jgi:hypothetical protein
MTKKSLRQQYIDKIMKEKYGDDEEKYSDSNLAFLETLSLDELAKMANMDEEFEDEFELESEVKDIDFNDDEL